jgi:hypothetical protein
MENAREILREAVAVMSEAEARQALEYLRRLRRGSVQNPLGRLFADDAAISVPELPYGPLPEVEPLSGRGTPASELLIRDRR